MATIKEAENAKGESRTSARLIAWNSIDLQEIMFPEKLRATLLHNLPLVREIGRLVKIRMVSNSNYLLLKYIKEDEDGNAAYQIYNIKTGDKVFHIVDSDISIAPKIQTTDSIAKRMRTHEI